RCSHRPSPPKGRFGSGDEIDPYRSRNRIHAPGGRALSALLRPRSVRFRLTISYVGAMVVVLGVYALLIFYFVSRNMSQFFDNQLRDDFEWALDMMHQTPDGDLRPYEETGENDSPWLRIFNPNGELRYA